MGRSNRVVMIGIFFVMWFCGVAHAEDNRVRAKIGIQVKSGEQQSSARSREMLKAGDSLRIYVHSEKDSYLYVVHTDGKVVNLLNMTAQKMQSSTLVLPSLQAYYKVDGGSPMERFSVICSQQELPELSKMANSKISFEQWRQIENDLVQRGKLLSAPGEKAPFSIAGDEAPFAIGGNVRGVLDEKGTDPFVRDLQIFSGNGVLVKQYEFQVKK